MSSETTEPTPFPRRKPKLFAEAPPPQEPAPLPRPIFRLRTTVPEPSEGPSKDKLRELFFITWKSQNPGGRADSEDFERAYGDFQIRQFEAKGYYRDRDTPLRLGPIIGRALFIIFLILAGLAAINWLGS
jgi:hypothetical protein